MVCGGGKDYIMVWASCAPSAVNVPASLSQKYQMGINRSIY